MIGWLFREPELGPGETVRWQRKVSMGPSTGNPDVRTAVAGVLFVTTKDRILLVPNRGNRRRYSDTREWPLADVTYVGISDRDMKAYTGGMQKRLCLTLRDGSDLLFVLSRRDEAVDELRALTAPKPG